MDPTPPATVPDCPVCAAPLGEDRRECPRCQTPHHPDCWDYLEDCAIFGCKPGSDLPVTAEPASTEIEAARFTPALIRTWAGVHRFHWWTLVASVGGSLLLGGAILLGNSIFWQNWLLAPTLPLLLWCLTLIPSSALGTFLQNRLGEPLPRPHKRVTPLLESTELSGQGGALLRMVEVAPRVFPVLCLLLYGYAHANLAFYLRPSLVELVTLLLTGMVGLGMLREATRERLLHVEVTQNRLIAWSKANR